MATLIDGKAVADRLHHQTAQAVEKSRVTNLCADETQGVCRGGD